MLKSRDFLVNWVEEASDEPEGTVIRQEPAADEEANKGSFVTVYVSIGAEKMYMPNLELESREDAERMIESLGLTVGRISQDNSNSVAAGKVISQSIARGTEVKKGDSVDLVIRLGPKSQSPAKPAQTQQTTRPAQTPAPTQAPIQTPAPTLPPTQAPVIPETPAPTQAPAPPPTPAPTQAPAPPPTPAPTQPPTQAPQPEGGGEDWRPY